MDTCRSCGAPVLWVKTQAGKAFALDAEPVPEGNLIVSGGVAHFLKPGEATDLPRFRSHFSTCPQAQAHRKPRTKE